MTFKQAIKNDIKNAFNLQGRATRAEYWYLFLGTIIVNSIYVGLVWAAYNHVYVEQFITIIMMFITLYIDIMTFTVTVRRLHDVGKSGWILLLTIIPILNFYILYLLLLPSQPELNKYGYPMQ